MSSIGRSPFPVNHRNRRRMELEDSVASSTFASPSFFSLGAPSTTRQSPSSSYLSPTHSGGSSRGKPTRRFFANSSGGNINLNGSMNTNNSSAVSTNSSIHKTPTDVKTMDLHHIQQLARHCMDYRTTASPDMAVFYASILYTKTQSPQDAYFYAQTLARNHELRRAVRILDQANLISTNRNSLCQQFDDTTPFITLEAVLLASQCLANLGDWQEATQLLEDASRLPDVPTILTDDDEEGWNELFKHYSPKSDNTSIVAVDGDSTNDDDKDSIGNMIHVVSRVCLWRARCYDATSHPPRAKIFWKRAVKLDYQCVAALDSLLERNLLTPQESSNIILNLPIPKSMDWLKQIYLARLPVLSSFDQQDENSIIQEEYENHQPPTSFINSASVAGGFHDTSSIRMSPGSSLFVTPPDENNKYINQSRNRSNNYAAVSSNSNSNYPAKEIAGALDKLYLVHQLQHSPEVLALAAIRAYKKYDLQSSFSFCQELVRVDPLTPKASFVHAATLLALDYKRLLFGLAHEWVKASPQSAKSWFAVGCYYFACKRYHVAQQHFCRATRLDPLCTDAWIAFGCAFAACDESDQALASFRAAQRLAPAEFSALLYMGMEYVRTNHLVLAQHALLAALPGNDPLCLHELGVAHFAKKDYNNAISWFQKAVVEIAKLHTSNESGDNIALLVQHNNIEYFVEMVQHEYWEPTLFNLGHCYRKNLNFPHALICFEKCLVLRPDNPSVLTAIGFTKHLMGDARNLDGAIETYHQALAKKSDNGFATEMLNRALEEALSTKFGLNIESERNDDLTSPISVPPSVKRPSDTPHSAVTFSLDDDDDSDDVDMSMG
mmetsp:Transcript_37243/g.42521  ORF Transcript_37243/g.42521 Transcript_37243/m.42521 type:complete len:836 (-) Transcript_37243:278-2785(-)